MLRPTRSIFVVFPLIFFACVNPAHADWVVGANATDSDGTHAMADCLFGFWYTNATAEHAYTVQIAAQVSVLDEMNAPCKLLFRDFTKHPYDYWQLLVHAGPQYAEDTVHFKLWTFSGPTWDTYQSDDVFLRVVDDPMGRYSPGQILWQGSIGPETSRENPTFEVEIWANKTPDPWMDGLRLEFGSPDAYPPVGSIVINSGAAATPAPEVTLTLTAVDYGSGVVAMRLSNDALQWEPWEPYVSTRSWTLIPGNGMRTVYAQFKDAYGNVCSPVGDSIWLGQSVPTCFVTINDDAPFATSTRVWLDTTAESANGEVTGIRFSNDGIDWASWQTFDQHLYWTIPIGDGTKTVYAQVKDVAGAESDTVTDSIILDTQPPTGTIIINSGDAYATSFNVTLALTAEDTLSGLTDMAFRENAGWTEWEPFANTRNWTLSSGDGDKSVGVRFRDMAGNYSSTMTDLITVDTTPPVGSILINGGDIYTESTTVELTISATDAGIGVADMRLRAQGMQWPEWEPYEESRSWTLSPQNGIHVIEVQYRDGLNHESEIYQDSIILGDTQAAPAVFDDGLYTGPTGSIHAEWIPPEDFPNIVEYQYAVVELNGTPSDWQSVGTSTEMTEPGGAFAVGNRYFVCVKARNGDGVWSEMGSSDGIIISTAASIGEAKYDFAGIPVYISDAVVTSNASETAGMWVLAEKRYAGMKVDADWDTSHGDRVDVAGVPIWVDGVPILAVPELKEQIPGDPLLAPYLQQHELANDRRESLTYEIMNPVGWLLKMIGNVTAVDASGGVFYVDDGSNLADGMGPAEDPYRGVRIRYTPDIVPPAVGDYVTVVGVSTVEKTVLEHDAYVNGEPRQEGETLYVPFIAVRTQSDIEVY